MELSNQLPGSHPLTAPVHPPERVTGPPELHHSEGRYRLSRDQDLGEIQFLHQIQQEIHLVVLCQPLTRRGRQQGGPIRLPGPKRLGLLHAQFSQPDPLQSRRSGRIQERLWSAGRGAMRDRLLEALLATGDITRMRCMLIQFHRQPAGTAQKQG